jgi:CelD/BcsL family acetyltransferase involved in cellulose biosynthesis
VSAALRDPERAPLQLGSLGELQSLEAEWEPLLRASAADGPFLSWEWLSAWWTHAGASRRLAILTLRRAGELVAALPLAGARRRVFGCWGPPVLQLLGDGPAGADHLDLVARRDDERPAVAELARALRARRTAGDLVRLREGSLAGLLARQLAEGGWRVRLTQHERCPYVSLDGGWDGVLARLGAEHRASVRRRLRRAAALGARLVDARTEPERREALAILLELHRRRWDARGGSDAFHTPALRALHEQFSAAALRRGWLRLSVLWLGSRPAAAVYGLLYGRTFYYYQAGFDPELRRLSPGLVALALCLRRSIDEGALEADLLHGDEEYKRRWTRLSRPLERAELSPPGVGEGLWRRALDVERRARRLARRSLPRAVLARYDAARRAAASGVPLRREALP